MDSYCNGSIGRTLGKASGERTMAHLPCVRFMPYFAIFCPLVLSCIHARAAPGRSVLAVAHVRAPGASSWSRCATSAAAEDRTSASTQGFWSAGLSD